VKASDVFTGEGEYVMKKIALILLTCAAVMQASLALAGPLDPECTAEKAAKSAAAKATVGVGGRCSPAEASKDKAKNVAGIEEKGAMEKRKNQNETLAEKSKDVAKKAVK
jgi:accessory colonization factor AcfC